MRISFLPLQYSCSEALNSAQMSKSPDFYLWLPWFLLTSKLHFKSVRKCPKHPFFVWSPSDSRSVCRLKSSFRHASNRVKADESGEWTSKFKGWHDWLKELLLLLVVLLLALVLFFSNSNRLTSNSGNDIFISSSSNCSNCSSIIILLLVVVAIVVVDI